MGAKLAITGKGGVGKTTITSLLAMALLDKHRRVLVVDADPNATLAACLGFPDPDTIPPLNEMSELIEERTGVKPGSSGLIFKLNPRVDDIPDRFAVQHNGIRLLRMGSIKTGGTGCYCPENAFLKTLVTHLLLSDQDILLLDMEAGVEHLGRGTAQAVDWLLIAVEPSRQSMHTAKRIQSLAHDIGITNIGIVGNKCRDGSDTEFIMNAADPVPVLGTLPLDDHLRRSELDGHAPEPSLPEVGVQIEHIINQLI